MMADTEVGAQLILTLKKTSWEEIGAKDLFPREEDKAGLTFDQVSKSFQHPFVLPGILTRVFPDLGTVPTLQDPAGPYDREARQELGGAGGVLALVLPSCGALGLCLGAPDLCVQWE